jgi:hypothetical protein
MRGWWELLLADNLAVLVEGDQVKVVFPKSMPIETMCM